MKGLTFGSLCSGIEAASEAWLPLDWECRYVAEVDPFPCSYLAQTYGAGRPLRLPTQKAAVVKALDRVAWGDRLPNFGDVSQIQARELPAVDVMAAGFPCQDFSIAGLRASLSGARGNLSTIGVRLLLEAANLGLVRGAVLEQVPDVLNTVDNAWGNILGALVGSDDALTGLEHGGKWPRSGMVAGPRARIAWRILDAQHFGLAQRRERVWAVVDFGDGPDPAAVLLERKGVFGDFAPRGKAGKRTSHAPDGSADGRCEQAGRPTVGRPTPEVSVPFGCDYGQEIGRPLVASQAGNRSDIETETVVVGTLTAGDKCAGSATLQAAEAGHLGDHSLRGEGFDASEDGTGRGTPIVPAAFTCKDYGADAGPLSPTLRAMGHHGSHANAGGQAAVAYDIASDALDRSGEGAGGTAGERSGLGITEGLSPTLKAKGPGAVAYSIMPQNSGKDYKAREVDVAQPLMASGPVGGNQGGDYVVAPIAFNSREDVVSSEERFGSLGSSSPQAQAVAFSLRGREGGAMPEVEGGDLSPALRAAEGGSTRPFIAGQMAVRRITVVEAEILQGFRPNATLIHWPTANRKGQDLAETIAYLIGHGCSEADAQVLAQTPDGPRYKAIGNSWPVPVARWIGERIAENMKPR